MTFVVDITTPLGMAAGVPYVVPVLISLWSQRRSITFGTAAIGTLLTFIGFLLSPSGGEQWHVITNRSLAIFAIWMTATLCLWQKQQKRQSAHLSIRNALLVAKRQQLAASLERVSQQKEQLTAVNVDLEASRSATINMHREAKVAHQQSEKAELKQQQLQVELQEQVLEMERAQEIAIKMVWDVESESVERKHAESELRKSHAYTKNIIESMFNMLVVVSPDGIIVNVNEATCTLLKYREDELIGKSAQLVFAEEKELKEGNPSTRSVSQKAMPVKGKVRQALYREGHVSDIEGWYTAKDGNRVPVSISGSVMHNDKNEIQGIVFIAQDITERKKNEEQLRLQSVALESAANAIVISDRDGRITWTNRAFCKLTGYSREEAIGNETRILKSGQHDTAFYTHLWQTVLAGKVWHGELVNRRKDGSLFTDESTITPVMDDNGEITHFIAVKQDITERKKAEFKQKQLQCELALAQKLESVGQLAAGIAHEINTPIQYVGDNTRFLKDAFADLSTALDKFEKLLQAAKDGTIDEPLLAEVEAALKEADTEYLKDEIPQAINQSLNGTERVAKIVRAMKEFSHPGGEEKSLVSLTETIETTITVARSEWKYVADMVTEFDPQLPKVLCLQGDLNQVILNLIVNAAHAIGDTLSESSVEKGTITVATCHDGEWVEIYVRDTGTGISEEIRSRIFDPFFTTKDVGKGTGQGLAIARSVVVDKHGGTIDCQSELGKGTTFVVRLPINGQQKGEVNEYANACSGV